MGGPNLQSHVNFWLCGHMANKENTSTIPMAIKLGRVVTYGQQTSHTKSRYLLIKWSRDKCKTLYLTSKISLVTKLGRVVTCRLVTYPNFKVMWTFDCVVTWQTKKKIISKKLYLWPPSYMIFLSHGHVTNIKPYICTSAVLMITKLGRVATCGVGTQPSNSRDLMIMRSRKKWKKTFLHLHNTYGHQTW